MAYRFTDTNKWNDPWFLELKPFSKLLFMYLCDQCDIAGFLEINTRKIAFDLGADIQAVERGLKEVSERIVYSLNERYVFVVNFIKHQKNLPLNENNNAHKGIIARLNENKEYFDNKAFNHLDLAPNKPLIRGIGNGKGKGVENKEKGGMGEKETLFKFSLSDGSEKIITISLSQTMNKLLSDVIWLEPLCMNNAINLIQAQDYIKKFFIDLESRGESYKLENDAKHHFANWLKIELDRHEKEIARDKNKFQGYKHPFSRYQQNKEAEVDERF